MRVIGRKAAVCALAGITVLYMASPYIALYRLEQALRAGDIDAVDDAIDWNQVRAGLKQQVVAEATGATVRQVSDGHDLPAFGASFMAGIATHMVDKVVTPEGLCMAMHRAGDDPDAEAPPPHIVWAFFDGPAVFTVQLRPAGSAAAATPLTLRLQLEGARWKVTRVVLPEGAKARA
ncbi:MAG TPA: DUF2939 domain-containing protein [Acetobacteraceae bacterium]|nr:DUF2939 domain-containing protein [Acetobacteraceae bacterium]